MTGKETAVIPTAETGPDALDTEKTGIAIREIIRPLLQGMARMIENNTAALEQLAQAQAIQNDRLEALEKLTRLQTPVNSTQARYLNDAIRKRARELMDKRGVTDSKAVNKLAAAIKRAALTRYGASVTREVPRHEYQVALSMIEMWYDALTVRDIAREAKQREEAADANAHG